MLDILRRYGVWPLTLALGLLSVAGSVALTALLETMLKGHLVAANLAIAALVSSAIAFPVIYVILRLTFRLDCTEQHLLLLTREDPLTSVSNRRHFFEAATSEFERCKRYASPLTVIMMDLDCFKQVNDRYGHRTGDNVLCEVAQLTRSVMRSTDLVARYGGDEFVIMLPQTSLEEAAMLAERLRGRINILAILVDAQPLQMSVSMGVSECMDEDADFDAALSRADAALYQAKAAGRNCTFYQHAGNDSKLASSFPTGNSGRAAEAKADLR